MRLPRHCHSEEEQGSNHARQYLVSARHGGSVVRRIERVDPFLTTGC
jgi:hypothetical protein